MTVSKRGRVPKTIKEAVQEQFTRMGDYNASVKRRNKESISSFIVYRDIGQPDPVIYTFTVHGTEIRYTRCDTNTCEAAQKTLSFSEDAFFQFQTQCDLPLDFDAFTEIMRQISVHGLSVSAFIK